MFMASELGVNLVCTSGPVLERSGDLAAILTNLNRHDILFVDEIHRMMFPAVGGGCLFQFVVWRNIETSTDKVKHISSDNEM